MNDKVGSLHQFVKRPPVTPNLYINVRSPSRVRFPPQTAIGTSERRLYKAVKWFLRGANGYDFRA